MSQNSANVVHWSFLGSFLSAARTQVEELLATIPGAKLSGIEITLYPHIGTEAPMEEYNLSSGEIGERFIPDDQIIDEDEQQSFRHEEKHTFWDWVKMIFRAIWLWFLRLLKKEEMYTNNKRSYEDSKMSSQNLYPPSSTDDLVQELLFSIANDLSSKPEVNGFSVGVRALVTASPTCASGTRCEFRALPLDKVGWWWRNYYTKWDGTCGRRWTTRC